MSAGSGFEPHGTTILCVRRNGVVAMGGDGQVTLGNTVMKGYLNAPEATAAMLDADGWLHTGDLGRIDEQGYVYIVDRIADFIKSWGVRVSSQEIEEVALALPGVIAAAAVGVPDVVAGESIVLFVVGEGLSDAALLESLRGRLTKHMVPSRVAIVDALPLNANGKPAKALLRAQAVGDNAASSES